MSFLRPALLSLLAVGLFHTAAAAGEFSTIPDPSRGALIYVPIYSSIFYKDSARTIELAATLSIHNIDPDHSLTLTRVDYHDTDGKLVRHHLEQPLVLAPLVTKNYVISQADRTGGTGANFMVAWKSDVPIAPPIVEALMVSVSSQTISFTASGKIVRSADARE
ncbi:MAG TPA: DUF3124 domain-containing protein [Chthoniobacterales bacterium]